MLKETYKNSSLKFSDIMGWIVLMPKDKEGNLEMRHFESKEEALNFIDEMQNQKEKEQEVTRKEYWYNKY